MAVVTRTLSFVGVSSGRLVDRLETLSDGTVRPAGDLAAGVLASLVQSDQLTEQAAFDWLATNGWSNGSLMIDLSGLDGAS